MKVFPEKSVTLLELIISMVIVGMIVFSFFSIHLFSRYHLITSIRRAKLQNDVSYILEHMAKQISNSIGNENIYGASSVAANITTANAIRINFYIDASRDGIRGNPQNNPPQNVDHWISYRYDTLGADQYSITYCGRCQQSNCVNCMDSEERLSAKITNFTPIINRNPDNTLRDNYVEVRVTSCWDPTNSNSCGYSENPVVSMNTRVKMPSVSAR